MADPRWTDETTALVERIVERATRFDIDCAGPGEAKAATEEHAFAVLDALATAGVLLPPDGFTREEWGYRAKTNGIILRESQRTRFSTHSRFSTVWAVEGEPNDNWPRYVSPWREVAPDA
jgi:hypothetical protein